MVSSRRGFLRCLAGPLLAAPQQTDKLACLIREYPRTQFVALSPDGSLCCVKHGSNVRRFGAGIGGGGFFPIGSRKPENLSVLRVADWREVWTSPLPGDLRGASFFADGDRLFVEARLDASREVARFVHNFALSKEEFRAVRADEASAVIHSYAYAKGTVIHTRMPISRDRNTSLRLDRVAILDWTVLEGGLDMEERKESSPYSFVRAGFSLNRESFVQIVDAKVECRRSVDFGLAWSNLIEPWFYARSVGISETGAYVVAGMREKGVVKGRERKFFAAVLDGRDGKLVKRIDVPGVEAVAISGDGRLVAVGARVDDLPRRGMIQTMIRVFDVESGKELAVLVHGEIKMERRLESGFGAYGLQFVPGGRYLISSGEATRVWELGGC